MLCLIDGCSENNKFLISVILFLASSKPSSVFFCVLTIIENVPLKLSKTIYGKGKMLDSLLNIIAAMLLAWIVYSTFDDNDNYPFP